MQGAIGENWNDHDLSEFTNIAADKFCPYIEYSYRILTMCNSVNYK